MQTGYYISGAGHLGLIGWLLFGGLFSSAPPPLQTQEVTLISGSEFEAILAAQRAPSQATEVAQPAAPEITPETPAVTSQPEAPIEQPQPIQTETPPDPAPEVTEQSLPPEAVVDDDAPLSPEPPAETAVLVPNVAPEAVPRPVERVAPEPVAQPDPEVTPDTVETPAVAPDEPAETIVEEPQEATAPPEATTEIVTEVNKAPARSPRPPSNRPAARPPVQDVAETPAERPAQPSNPEPEAQPDTDAAAIAAAVAAAQNDVPETPAAAPSGPPLSEGEKETLRVAVSNCWNVGSLSTEALNTTVVVTVSMNPDGTPNAGSIRLAGSSGGSDGAARQAFEAARRAIIRCGARGYPLPSEKYSHWQNIEMTFNPEKMRVK